MHGSRRTYRSGCHCTICKRAEATYRATLRRNTLRGLPPLGATISAAEAWQKIRALKIEGMSRRAVGRKVGLAQLRIQPQRVTLRNLLRIRRVFRAVMLGGEQPAA